MPVDSSAHIPHTASYDWQRQDNIPGAVGNIDVPDSRISHISGIYGFQGR